MNTITTELTLALDDAAYYWRKFMDAEPGSTAEWSMLATCKLAQGKAAGMIFATDPEHGMNVAHDRAVSLTHAVGAAKAQNKGWNVVHYADGYVVETWAKESQTIG